MVLQWLTSLSLFNCRFKKNDLSFFLPLESNQRATNIEQIETNQQQTNYILSSLTQSIDRLTSQLGIQKHLPPWREKRPYQSPTEDLIRTQPNSQQRQIKRMKPSSPMINLMLNPIRIIHLNQNVIMILHIYPSANKSQKHQTKIFSRTSNQNLSLQWKDPYKIQKSRRKCKRKC